MRKLRKQEKKQSADLSEGLEQLGLEHHTEIDPESYKWLDAALSVQQMQSHKKLALGTGDYRGSSVYILLLETMLYTGQAVIAMRHSVCIIPFEKPVPDMTIKKRNMYHSIGRFFGANVPRFHSHPGFESKYTVIGEDIEGIEAVLNVRTLEYLEANPWVYWYFRENILIYFQSGKAWYSHEDLKRFIDLGIDLKERIQQAS